MTAKEAIKNIKGLIDGCCGPELDDTREAFDLAIKALGAQDGTDTNVGGTISRQAAIDALHTKFKDGFNEDKWWNSTHVLAAIKGLPSAEPEKVCIAKITLSEEQIREAVEKAKSGIVQVLPSAQPEPPTEIQEILDYLDTTLHPIVSPDNWNVYSELHDMISRLPSAQPEPCEDCISREAVMEHYRVTDPAGTFAYCDTILEFVSSLPSVTPARKKGKVIEIDGLYRCPFCYAHKWGDYKFCENCGAELSSEVKSVTPARESEANG